MNLKKLFIADNEGKLDEFLDGLEPKQLKLLVQQIKDELKRYEVVTKNYDKEKYEKFAQPYIDKRLGYGNRIAKTLERKVQGPK